MLAIVGRRAGPVQSVFWREAAPGTRHRARAGSTRDLVSGGGAGGLPPANFLGAFSASPNPLARPINSTENSGEP